MKRDFKKQPLTFWEDAIGSSFLTMLVIIGGAALLGRVLNWLGLGQ